MTAPDYARLSEVTDAATPGPWAIADEGYGEQYVYDEPTGSMCWTPDNEDHWSPADAAFIAAWNPATARQVLDERDELLAKIAELEREIDERDKAHEGIVAMLGKEARADIASARAKVGLLAQRLDDMTLSRDKHRNRTRRLRESISNWRSCDCWEDCHCQDLHAALLSVDGSGPEAVKE